MNGKKRIVMIVLAVMTIVMAATGFYYWYENAYYVATEDAKVTGDLFRVGPQLSGKLVEFQASEGDEVVKGQILGRQEMLNQPDSAIDMSVLRAPISGVVVKKQANIGEIVSPGQALAMVVDPKALYISANIEETKLHRVKPGQVVDVTIDQFEGEAFKGTVTTIGQASNSAFSLLPSASSGNFTKVVQKVPVKIIIPNLKEKLLPGTNAVVKIHVK